MKLLKQFGQRILCVSACLVLLFTSGLQVSAKTDSSIYQSVKNRSVKPSEKISNDLVEIFNTKDEVTYLIKLQEQVNTQEIAAQAEEKAALDKMSLAKIELRKRSEIVSALRSASMTTQTNLTSFLDNQKELGNVKDYESFYIVNAMAITSTKEVMESIAEFNEVEKILPNRTRQLIETDGSTSKQKLKEIGTNKLKNNEIAPNIERIGAPHVWEEGIDGTGVVVASIDTGVQWDHPALLTKYRGYNSDKPNKPNNEFNWFDATADIDTPYDDNGHGTHTVGTMVGSEPDGTHQIGVAPGAQWIGVKAFTALGGTDADILAAGEWVLAPKDADGNPHPEKAPDIVNNSWGGGPGMNDWYRPMVQNWRASGIFPAFAAGNTTKDNPGGPGSVTEPGNYPESFTVGAVDNNDKLADFSLLGPSPYGEIKPDVVAPGVNIFSAIPGSDYTDGYSGTSMATPAVAGAVALIKQADASLTVGEIEQILINTATTLTDSEYPKSPSNGYGYGIINVFNAVSSITKGLSTVQGKATTEGTDNEAPTYQHEKPTEAFTSIGIPLQISVQDNIGIDKVELEYRTDKNSDWQKLEAVRTSGDYSDGIFSVTIPDSAVVEPSVTYRWKIYDYGKNNVTTDVYQILVKSSVTLGYEMDFETVPYGWVSYGDNDTWEWGKPVSGPQSAFSGDNVYATNLDGDYKNNSNMSLMMPPIALPEGDSYLQFKHWHKFADKADIGQVLISTDKENWEPLNIIDGSSNSWKDAQVKLSSFAGNTIYIAFHMQSSSSVTSDGWYLDDVILSDLPLDQDTVPPTYVHDSPANAYRGMNLPLQISVEDNERINNVELQYRSGDGNWKTAHTSIIKGSNKKGVYETFIPAENVADSLLEYKWSISDYGGNETISEIYEISVEEGITTGYRADFESNPGWITSGENNSWERGIPTYGPKKAISGENVYGTNLSGPYNNNSDAMLMMPPIDLPAGEAYLQLKHWYEFENYYPFDQGKILISTDQNKWSTLATFSHINNIWQYLEIDISDYENQRVYIAFHIFSDTMGTGAGWYLDDVVLSDTSIFDMSSHDILLPTMEHSSQELIRSKSINASNIKNNPKNTTINLNTEQVTLIPGKPVDVSLPILKAKIDKIKNLGVASTIPLDAKVTVQELNRYVKTDIRDGSYSIIVPGGTYTLQAEAYGYYPTIKSVDIEEKKIVEEDFSLEPIPEGTITGILTDEATDELISGASLLIMEDAAVTPVKTDENGEFSITAFEGQYTLRIINPKYHNKDVTIDIIGDEDTTLNIKLEPFVNGPSDELAYDDGSAEGYRAFFDAGDGWAVRMSLAEGQENALVTGGKFLFSKEFPNPGGVEFQVEVWDSSGEDGSPGKKLLGPIDATALRNDQWTIVDLSDYGIIVHDDFYMVSVQTKANPYSPAIAIDENSTVAKRGWGFVAGRWQQAPTNHGNYMIRSIVDYEATAPVISSPSNDSFTAKKTVQVIGNTTPKIDVVILNNGNEITTVLSNNEGIFTTEISLDDGENILSSYVVTDSGPTESSEEVRIILDQDLPDLTIDKPIDGLKTKDMAVTVVGTANDANLDEVRVNGEISEVNSDGIYSHRVLLDEGKNVIRVTAIDKAGNEQVKEVTLFAKFNAPEITNLTPSEDVYLKTGKSVKIEFDSESKLKATFIVHRSPVDITSRLEHKFIEVPMMEMKKGKYVGYWTVPSNWSSKEAYIQVLVKDEFGNSTEQFTDGTVFVNTQPHNSIDSIKTLKND